ncbi:hypothetical protein ACJIZ3_022073 [Penstemon smallii]|uniref:Homeobox domain-containing protein n=1 Tax=Penstemon smallii TaxID=265156 RepID=A0ABD3SN72_9LAMI
MAEGFEPFLHVPQQSRRDKLRVNNNNNNNLHGYEALVPFYDPFTCSTNLHGQSFNLSTSNTTNTADSVKEEGTNLMGFMGGTTNHHMYVDPQLNPSTIQDINGGQYVYTSPHNYRAVSFHGNNSETVPYNGQSLSLSLSSHQTHNSNLPLELNLQRYDEPSVFSTSNNKVTGGYFGPGGNGGGGGSTSIDFSRSSVPLGPFTGYAFVLKGSRFLKPAHQLLEELCNVNKGLYAERVVPDSLLMDSSPLESFSGNGIVDESLNCSDGGNEQTRKKSRLLSMLDEVYKRYRLYYQQMQAVAASFESVAGLSNAAPFANLALKALSKHFKCLKNAITDQLQFAAKSHGKGNYDRDETQRLGNSGRGPYSQRTFQNSGFVDQPVWRPQRGLPERAVTVLRAWLFEHFLHPYPTDTDKLMLAKQTGLSRNQVSNWFINARVRLWKPMVEEIHMLETRQTQKPSERDDQHPNGLNDHFPTNCSIECENGTSSRIGEFPLKRTREDLTEAPRGNGGQMNFLYENLSHNPHMGNNTISNNAGVSLTLGLHQNGVGLSESYPITAARHFGLDAHGDGYNMMSGFTTQNRQFERDIIG